MKRNSTTLFLTSPGATTPIPWINNAPDFSAFTEPTLSVLLKAWQDFITSGGELEIIPDPVPVVEQPVPNWDGFNAVLIQDPAYHEAVGKVRASPRPGLDTPVVVALSQVSTNGVASFALAFPPFCYFGEVSTEQRNTWADLAQSFNLPGDFVNIVRGED